MNIYIYVYWDNTWSGCFFCAGQVSSLHGPGVSQEKNNSPMRGSRWVSGLISWFSKEFGGFEHFQLELVVWNMTLFSPIIGMMIQSDFHIFQGGWNHQPDFLGLFLGFFSVCELLWFFDRCSALLPLWFSPWAPNSACETWNQRMAQNYTCTDTKLSETTSTSDATYGYSSVFFPPDQMIDHLKHLKQGELPNVFGTNDNDTLAATQAKSIDSCPWSRCSAWICRRCTLWSFPYAKHGAGICTPTFGRKKSPSFVGKYTSTMEHMGL